MPHPHSKIEPAEGEMPLLQSLGQLYVHLGADPSAYLAALAELGLVDEEHPPEPPGVAGSLLCTVLRVNHREQSSELRQAALPQGCMSRGLLAAVLGAAREQRTQRAAAVHVAVEALCFLLGAAPSPGTPLFTSVQE